jgi:hypothetical protein
LGPPDRGDRKTLRALRRGERNALVRHEESQDLFYMAVVALVLLRTKELDPNSQLQLSGSSTLPCSLDPDRRTREADRFLRVGEDNSHVIYRP